MVGFGLEKSKMLCLSMGTDSLSAKALLLSLQIVQAASECKERQ
jgi:hypothetical protein